jgi:hypothetical protein
VTASSDAVFALNRDQYGAGSSRRRINGRCLASVADSHWIYVSYLFIAVIESTTII